MAALTATMQRFSHFFIPRHAPYDQSHNACQHSQNKECTHLYTSRGIYAALFFLDFILNVLLSL